MFLLVNDLVDLKKLLKNKVSLKGPYGKNRFRMRWVSSSDSAYCFQLTT